MRCNDRPFPSGRFHIRESRPLTQFLAEAEGGSDGFLAFKLLAYAVELS
jgi:hypothetical protein